MRWETSPEWLRPGEPFISAEQALSELGLGRVIVVLDRRDGRESGSFVTAARNISRSSLLLLLGYGRGQIKVGLSHSRGAELGLCRGPSPHTNRVSVRSREQDAADVSIEGCLRTIRTLADPDATAADLASPGMVLAVIAGRDEGGGEGVGEPAILLNVVRRSGLGEAVVYCEIADPDGSAAGAETIADLADRYALPIARQASLSEIGRGQVRSERAVRVGLPLEYGDFEVVGYRDLFDGAEHIALIRGDLSAARVIAVHSACIWGDVFRSNGCGCRARLESSLRAVNQAGSGVVVYVGHPPAKRLEDAHEPIDHCIWREILEDLGADPSLVDVDSLARA